MPRSARSTLEKGLDLPKRVAFVAGHSLGEYSALAAVGSLSLADTARLLKIRGRAMQAAVPVGQGAMAALLGAELPQAEELAAAASDGEVCQAANDNAPGQVVISGHARGDRTRRGACAQIRRAPCRAVAGERALPLRLDAAGG